MRQIKDDYRKAALDPATRALLDYAAKLTGTPWDMTEADVRSLRDAGFSDRAILDGVEIVGYFNYINRVADAVGLREEPGIEG